MSAGIGISRFYWGKIIFDASEGIGKRTLDEVSFLPEKVLEKVHV